jgi:hypothetical protein
MKLTIARLKLIPMIIFFVWLRLMGCMCIKNFLSMFNKAIILFTC